MAGRLCVREPLDGEGGIGQSRSCGFDARCTDDAPKISQRLEAALLR